MVEKMKLYFVRHGKTEWNLEKRLQGQKGDSPLLAESFETIARVREYLSETKFERVISSPQKRAVITAQLLTDQQVFTDERLSEWNFGELEGQLISEALAKYPLEMENSRFHLDKFDGSPFGAESVSSVLSRFDALAQELLKLDMENILLVGHGASGTAGIRHLSGFPLSELRSDGGLENNTLSILENTGTSWKMLEWNRRI